MARDDFLVAVKKAVAERAGYLCSAPFCDHFTIGPHSNPWKSKNLGMAAHIHAASPGGPRYDENQTKEERRAIDNAIWVCHHCGTDIDADASPYDADTLREWKESHEGMVSELQKLGFRQVLRLQVAPQAEQDMAARLLACLADRGVLYELYDAETPLYSGKSIDIVRRSLTDLRSEARHYPRLEKHIVVMLGACRLFMRGAGHLVSERTLAEEPDWAFVERFRAALARLRKTIGADVKVIADTYGLPVPAELGAIVPKLEASQ